MRPIPSIQTMECYYFRDKLSELLWQSAPTRATFQQSGHSSCKTVSREVSVTASLQNRELLHSRCEIRMAEPAWGWGDGLLRPLPRPARKRQTYPENMHSAEAIIRTISRSLGVTWFWTEQELQPSIFPEAFFHYQRVSYGTEDHWATYICLQSVLFSRDSTGKCQNIPAEL